MSVRHRRETFTSSGTWTVPAGVTYAIVQVMGGGGGESGSGGTSSVAFSGGTVSALGGTATGVDGSITSRISRINGVANSGHSSYTNGDRNSAAARANGSLGNAATARMLTYGGTVTPAESITVTVGSGGTGTATGGSGLVIIEYTEEV